MPKAASTARTSSERFGNSSRNKGGTMKKTALAGVFVLLFVFAMTSPSSSQTRGQAPANMPGAFTFIPKADLEAVMGPTRGDRPARVVNIAGGANLGVYILHYPATKNPTPPSSFYHSEISELYYVIRGEGTALLGGELDKAVWGDPNRTTIREVRGPSVNGTINNYKTQRESAG